jgi:hypothetical protein
MPPLSVPMSTVSGRSPPFPRHALTLIDHGAAPLRPSADPAPLQEHAMRLRGTGSGPRGPPHGRTMPGLPGHEPD